MPAKRDANSFLPEEETNAAFFNRVTRVDQSLHAIALIALE
jgi:hypothetical protein